MAGVYDLAIIGGGVNGCGIARDAAGRGLSAVLFEQGDLGGATSSASTKLIHGGLRYLEYYQFRLVREALREREVLLRAAPHLVWPIRLILPHHAGLRPRWLLRLGLFAYDHLATGRTLPATRTIDLRHDPAGVPLQSIYRTAFEFSDCRVDDSRLVILNAIDARARNASINPRTRCVSAKRQDGLWTLKLESTETQEPSIVLARALVNAAGPWASAVLQHIVSAKTPARVRLVKGSHIVVRKLFDHGRAYMFQNKDGRILFVIPFEEDFTLIGTTDQDFTGEPANANADEDEIAYLCAAAGEYLRVPVRREDIVWTYSGVRGLYDDGASKAQEATRDYVLELDAPGGRAPLLTVFGGKITSYRRLAEAALARLAPHVPICGAPWTAGAPLPGGDVPAGGIPALEWSLRKAHPFLSETHARRLVRAYGTRATALTANARGPKDLGRHFGAGLTEREVVYLMKEEWARNASDVLWRRSKLGLRFSEFETATLERFMAEARGSGSAPAA